MKITKRQLRKIIKEEKHVLQEQLEPGWDNVSGEDIVDGFYNAISQLVFDEWAAGGIDPTQDPEEVGYAIQAMQNLIADLEARNF